MLATRLTPHLKKMVRRNKALENQFLPKLREQLINNTSTDDPLLEERHTMARGLIHKYDNRALILLTMNCAAYCRFCNRRRKVSDIKSGLIDNIDLENIKRYLLKHPEIKELIFSGGDPLTVPALLKKALRKLSSLPQIKIIRVSTRLHLADPRKINEEVLDALRVIKKQSLYLMVHFEHPSEITVLTISAINRLRSVATMLLSQTVSLKGVNDNVEILYNLFSRLIEIGVKPYYFFRCDPVRGGEHFIVDLVREVAFVTELHQRLSGLAVPSYVVDAPDGHGKIPIPLNFWGYNSRKYRDFKGKIISTLSPKKPSVSKKH